MCLAPAFASQEFISEFKERDVHVLNEELRKLNGLAPRVKTLESVYAADTAANDSYVITLDKAPTEYTAGMVVYFKAVTANTGACTLNINGLGAKSLKSLNNQDPADNYIEAGSMVEAIYDGTNFQLLQPDANP